MIHDTFNTIKLSKLQSMIRRSGLWTTSLRIRFLSLPSEFDSGWHCRSNCFLLRLSFRFCLKLVIENNFLLFGYLQNFSKQRKNYFKISRLNHKKLPLLWIKNCQISAILDSLKALLICKWICKSKIYFTQIWTISSFIIGSMLYGASLVTQLLKRIHL